VPKLEKETSVEFGTRVGESLIGSGDPLPDEIIDDHEAATALDEITMNCVVCGWWYETNDIKIIDGESKCNDCSCYLVDNDGYIITA